MLFSLTNPEIAILMMGIFLFAVLLGFPIAFTLMAMGVGFGYYAYFDPTRMEHLFDNIIFQLFVQNTYTVMDNTVLTAVPLFLFMGYLVERAGIVSRLFTIVIGKPNKPSIPFQDLLPNDTGSKVVLMILIYVIFTWLASFLRLLLRARQESIRAGIFLELSQKAQKNVLSQEYEYFLTDNSSDLTNKILLNITRVSEKMIRPILQMASGIFISSFIGWSLGISKNSCNPYFEQNLEKLN